MRDKFNKFLYFLAASPIYPFTNSLPLNPLYPIYLLSRPILELSKIHPLFWIFLIYSIITFSFSFISNISNPTFDQTSHFISFGVVLITLLILIINFDLSSEDLFKIVYYAGLSYSILFVIYVYISGVPFFDVGRLKALNFPAYPQRFAPVLILSFFYSLRMLRVNILYFLPLTIILLMIFLTYTRSIYLSFIIAIFYYLTYLFIFKSSILFKIISSIFIVITFIGLSTLYISAENSDNENLITIYELFNSIYLAFYNVLASSEGTQIINSGSSEFYRLYFWSIALEIFFDNPILGTGFAGLYQYGYPEYGSVHSQWIDQLLRTGIIGTSIYVVFYIIIFKYYFHKNPFFCSWIMSLVIYGFFNETTKEIPVGIIFFTMLNFAINSEVKSKIII